MSRAIPEAARVLASKLERQFSRDAELAQSLADAHQRLSRANDLLWSGLHPDGLAAVYGEHPAAVDAVIAENHSEVLAAPDPLTAVQQVHQSIRKAFIDYQAAAEERRQLAADTGELIRELVNELAAAGWSENQAREANVHELATTTKQSNRE